MLQWTRNAFISMIDRNGYYYSRNNGSHSIFVNDEGKHITVPLRIKAVIAQRIIKENKLQI